MNFTCLFLWLLTFVRSDLPCFWWLDFMKLSCFLRCSCLFSMIKMINQRCKKVWKQYWVKVLADSEDLSEIKFIIAARCKNFGIFIALDFFYKVAQWELCTDQPEEATFQWTSFRFQAKTPKFKSFGVSSIYNWHKNFLHRFE